MFKILISDDNEMIRKMIKNAIDTLTIEKEVFISENLEDEIKIINQNRPDLVITDISKGNGHLMSGFDIIKKYNNESDFPIFIIVSGYNMHYELKSNNINNVWACFQKPFKIENLIAEIINIYEHLDL